jgi:hypothetical protein
MRNTRAARYRRLALGEDDKAKADLLFKIADECEEGRLCIAEWHSASRSYQEETQPRELPFKPWWQ